MATSELARNVQAGTSSRHERLVLGNAIWTARGRPYVGDRGPSGALAAAVGAM